MEGSLEDAQGLMKQVRGQRPVSRGKELRKSFLVDSSVGMLENNVCGEQPEPH